MNRISFELLMKQAEGYEKEALKISKSDVISAISRLYKAKEIYAVIIDRNESTFMREVVYRRFLRVQEICQNLTMKCKKQENPSQSQADVSWLGDCRIKPLFGFEEVFGLEDIKKKFRAHFIYKHRKQF